MTTAYIGMGSNLGDRMVNLTRALAALAGIPSTHVENVSNAYESAPAYVHDQPRFLNAVVAVSTALAADALLEHLLELEMTMGRMSRHDKGPRIIDLDLLLFGDEEWDSPDLVIPHPGITERDFVLTPLLEIAPRMVLPDGTHLKRSAARVGDVIADAGPIPDHGPGERVPIEPTSWVEVAASETTADRVLGFDAALQLASSVFQQEDIPFSWAPHEPGVDMDPFGLPIVFRLLVPVDYEERARELIDEIKAAPLIMLDGSEFPLPTDQEK